MYLPPDADILAGIKRDLAARKGPFRHDVVVGHELVSHYRGLRPTQAGILMAELGKRECRRLKKDDTGSTRTARMFVVGDDPALLTMKPNDLYAVFRAERGWPPE